MSRKRMVFIFASLRFGSDGATNKTVLNIESHSTINSANEHVSDVLHTFCATWGLRTRYCLSSSELLPSRKFEVFERQFLLE